MPTYAFRLRLLYYLNKQTIKLVCPRVSAQMESKWENVTFLTLCIYLVLFGIPIGLAYRFAHKRRLVKQGILYSSSISFAWEVYSEKWFVACRILFVRGLCDVKRCVAGPSDSCSGSLGPHRAGSMISRKMVLFRYLDRQWLRKVRYHDQHLKHLGHA